MILHVKCLRALYKTICKYVESDKVELFINDLLKVSGTNSSFKYVFKDLLEYVKSKSK